MPKYNLNIQNTPEKNYALGFLPQRNDPKYWYFDTSSRANLKDFQISSENRRIINKTQNFNFKLQSLNSFIYDNSVQKTIYNWVKTLNWDFPISSVKKIFTDHLFNYVYLWENDNHQIVAYSICYFSPKISHIAYVFYDPQYSHGNLPIRLSLQAIIDSHQQNLEYCYLGRFSKDIGYYKRNMPGFEYFQDNQWVKLIKS